MASVTRKNLLRYAGLASTTVIAVGAHGAGALASGDPAPTLRVGGLATTTWQFQTGIVLVLAGSAGLLAVWWRLSDAPVPAGWLVVTGIVWTLPLLLAPPLASRDVYSYACQGWLYDAGLSPYRVSPLDGQCPWTDAVAPTWLDSTAPYGPAGIAVAAVAALPGRHPMVFVTVLRVLIVAAILLAGAAGARLAQRCGVPPARAVLVGLVTPLVAVHGVSGAHLDAVVLALVVGGLWTATLRRGPAFLGAASAGLLIGLAIGIKVSAVVALPFVVILAVRQRVLVPALLAVGCAGLTLAAVTAALGLDFGWVTALSGTAGLTQWTSPPTAVGMCAGYVLRLAGLPELFDPAVLLARLAGLVVLAAAILALTVRAWHRRATIRAVLACCGWAMAASVVLAPVFYPWYALVPLAVLALSAPDRRTARRMMVATTALMLLVFPNGLGVATLTKAPGAVAVTTVIVALLATYLGIPGLRRRPRRRPGRVARV